jgi:hypothetical protein
MVKGKGKGHPRTGREGPEWGKKKYSSTSSLTSALIGPSVQRHAPAVLSPPPPRGKETRYPLYKRRSGSQGRSGRMRKILPPTGIRSSDRPARSESLYRRATPARSCILVRANIWNVCSSIQLRVSLYLLKRNFRWLPLPPPPHLSLSRSLHSSNLSSGRLSRTLSSSVLVVD